MIAVPGLCECTDQLQGGFEDLQPAVVIDANWLTWRYSRHESPK
jgi:hypothetical protein